MHRIDSTTAVDGRYVEAGGGQQRTVNTAEWFNAVQEEIAGLIEATGGTLDRYLETQLREAIIARAVDGFAQQLRATDVFVAQEDLSVGEGTYVWNGAPVQFGIFGVAQGVALTGNPVTLRLKGEVTLPKNGAEAISTGAILYWDNGAKECRTPGNIFLARPIGRAREDRLAAEPTVRVNLNGTAEFEP